MLRCAALCCAGGTLAQVLDDIVPWDVANVRVVSAVCAPPALKLLGERFPGLKIFTGARVEMMLGKRCNFGLDASDALCALGNKAACPPTAGQGPGSLSCDIAPALRGSTLRASPRRVRVSRHTMRPPCLRCKLGSRRQGVRNDSTKFKLFLAVFTGNAPRRAAASGSTDEYTGFAQRSATTVDRATARIQACFHRLIYHRRRELVVHNSRGGSLFRIILQERRRCAWMHPSKATQARPTQPQSLRNRRRPLPARELAMPPQLSKAQQKILRVATATPRDEQDQDLRDAVAGIALLCEAEQALTEAPLTEARIVEGSAKVLEARQKCSFGFDASDALRAALENKAAVAAAAQGPDSLFGPTACLLYEAAALTVLFGLAVEGEPGGAGWVANFTIMTNRLVAALQQERVHAQVQRALEQVGSPVTPGGVLAIILEMRIRNPWMAFLGGCSLRLEAQQ